MSLGVLHVILNKLNMSSTVSYILIIW